MDKIKKEIEKLRKEIRYHDYRYYVLNDPVISDNEYDKLYKSLVELEKEYPELITPESPTQRVSGIPVKVFEQVKHSLPMLSLENTYSIEEIKEWNERVKKLTGSKKYTFCVETKIDGLSCSIIYLNGTLLKGATRGDGITGEDVTNNIKTIKSIPLVIISERENIPELIEIRGEVYMTKESFKKLNEKMIENAQQPFANPRNAASGSLRQKDARITAERKLDFAVHSSGMIKGKLNFSTQIEFLQYAKKIGFPVVDSYKFCKDIKEVIDYCIFFQEEKRDSLKYEIDGMVIKINEIDLREEIGSTAKSPRWAIAYKFPARQVTTEVKDIVIQVGRTGVLTPVAELKPVECGGVVISRATLHNFDEIKRLNVKVGDTVLIERAGEVIPKIVKVVKQSEKKQNEFKIPERCPECSHEIVKEESEVAYRCPNPLCPAQIIRSVVHFAKREAMDIEGLGEAVVEQLVEKKLITDYSDIYRLSKDDLFKLPLFKEKKVENLLSAIERSKNRPLDRLIYALGIRHVGEKISQILADRYGSLDNLAKSSIEDLTSIEELGPIIANSIVQFFRQKRTSEIIKKLKSAGVNVTKEKVSTGNKQILAGMTFVFTGELKNFTRVQAETAVRELGGTTASTVTKKTDFVVVGESPGSKYEKAKKLNVKIIDENEFMKIIKVKGGENV